LSTASWKPVALISPLSSSRLTEKSLPSPRWFDQCLISERDVTRALIVHLFWYGDRPSIG